MNDLDKAAAFLKKTSVRGIVTGLSRAEELLRRMGDPQEKVPIIHVSGTNGKGSFGAMLTSVLKSAGYRTGGFSSPALTGLTDSFRVNCEEISEKKLADIILDIADIWETMDDKPTEFEVLTAAAYEMFVREKCDVAVVECGLGGDLDSTNVISSPLLSVITNIQRDHCGILGSTLEEIAAHKAGIIKPGRPVYYGGSAALDVIKAAAEMNSSRLYLPEPEDFRLISDNELTGTRFTYKDREITLSLLGTYQFANAINAVSCAEILNELGLSIPYSAVQQGLADVKWHGRFELMRKEPIVISDGAHNPDGIRQAADCIRKYFGGRKVALLIGVMADKEYCLYPELLGELTACVFAVTPDNPRSLDSRELAGVFSEKGIPAEAFTVLEKGVSAAYDYAKRTGTPLIALGSLYMYRQFTEALSKLK